LISIEDIRRITANPKLLEFCRFVIAQAGQRHFPDYRSIDLMEIAPLVKHVWVIDFRDGVENRPTLLFTGTHIDAHYGMNITGKCFEDIYVEDDFDTAIGNNYYQVYLQKKVSFTRRLAHYHDDRVDRFETIEAMLFPCSSNDEVIDFGIGYVEYSLGNSPPEKVFHLL
jgi:hypothetical protein